MYDAIVIGTGPAGATAARHVAAAGLDTLLIEKEKLPRVKRAAVHYLNMRYQILILRSRIRLLSVNALVQESGMGHAVLNQRHASV